MRDWKTYLPSKKFTVIAGTTLVLFGAILGIRSLIKYEQKKEALTAGTPSKKITIGQVVEQDSDEDGIKDWEETLWGTDPFKAVTFEIPDARYIEQKKKAMATTSGSADGGTPLNETQQIAREIFTTTLALNQSGALNADSANSIAESVAEYIQNYKGAEDYKYAVIKLAKDSTTTTVKKYYLAITDLLTKHIKKHDNSLYIVSISTESNDPDLLGQLDPIIKNNESTLSALLKMTVPADAGYIHLKVLNALNKINHNEKAMRDLFDNPIVALASIQQHPGNLADMQTALREMESYFEAKSSGN